LFPFALRLPYNSIFVYWIPVEQSKPGIFQNFSKVYSVALSMPKKPKTARATIVPKKPKTA